MSSWAPTSGIACRTGARAKAMMLSSRPSVAQTFMSPACLHLSIHSFSAGASFSASSRAAFKSTESLM
eukprot:11927030-Heterocapsa_arctica.AAC.1